MVENLWVPKLAAGSWEHLEGFADRMNQVKPREETSWEMALPQVPVRINPQALGPFQAVQRFSRTPGRCSVRDT